MKFALTIITASLALLFSARGRDPYRLPENYCEWLEWTPTQDRRPFLIRLFSAPSIWFEAGAKKGKVRVGGDGVAGGIRNEDDSITIKDLIPEKFGVGIKFEADL